MMAQVMVMMAQVMVLARVLVLGNMSAQAKAKTLALENHEAPHGTQAPELLVQKA